MVDQVFTGTITGGKKVYWFNLKNNKGTEVRLSNYGAILNKYILTNKLRSQQDIVLGFDSMEEYLSDRYLSSYPYFGAIIGRCANRIKNGKIQIGDNWYQLSRNAGEHCLHGGAMGFDRKVWDIAKVPDGADNKVAFHYLSVDGEEGFPGNLQVHISFELKETDELVMEYTASCDADTFVNLTHHDYFNLHPLKKPVAHHAAQIFASGYLEQDAGYIPTGRILPVNNTPYDFRNQKNIGRDWDRANGYNQSFVIDKDPYLLSLAARFYERTGGISLEVYSTANIAHFYTGKYLSETRGKNNEQYHAFGAFAIELQNYPNVATSNIILAAGNTFRQTTIYKTYCK
ncbi:MAG: galactose mutarotase [Chitinophagaceae bacterium]|nr:galactose mutarotase [Chitinophagaceae bacterium]